MVSRTNVVDALVIGAVVVAVLWMAPLPTLPRLSLLPPWPLYKVAVSVLSGLHATINRIGPPEMTLQYHASGYFATASLRAAAQLRVADCLKEGPQGLDQLAACTGTLPTHLVRLLRALQTIDVFHELSDGRWEQTELSDALRRDHPRSAAPLMVMMGGEQYVAMTSLAHTLRTGQPAFEHHYNTSFWEYMHHHAATRGEFQAALTAIARSAAGCLVDDFAAGFASLHGRSLVDIAGGYGELLLAIVRQHPTIKATLFELPSVAKDLRAGFAPALPPAVTVAEGDFFNAASIPRGHDAYLMKQILHDWSDEKCIEILSNLRQAMKPGAMLLVVDRLLHKGDSFFASHASFFVDLLMLSNFKNARERYEEDFRRLFEASGFRFVRAVPTRTAYSYLVGEAA